MRGKYEHDVFLSYHVTDLEKVRIIYEELKSLGLKVFWAYEEKRGKQVPEVIDNALKNSMNFAVYWSAETAKSGWVSHEAKKFYDDYFSKDKENRRMYVYKEDAVEEIAIPYYLLNHSRPESVNKLVKEINKNVLDSITTECHQVISNKSVKISDLEKEVDREKNKVKEAQNFYRHNRFWGYFSKNKEVHIFTCGRDVPGDRSIARGYGGRTNIDMWDYRTVTDITHFFASTYPSARVIIEDPVSKLTEHDLTEAVALANRFSSMRNMLEDKDCIIIGSPDVSDYAEMVLAEIHQIDSYAEERIKNKGFVIIKERKTTKSSFYWEVDQDSGRKRRSNSDNRAQNL